MQLTDHTDLGLRVLILLAAAAPERLTGTELAARHGVSHTHLQKVVQSLVAAGFASSFRGRGGGVQLAQPAVDIRIGEVVRALEPHMHLVACFRAGPSTCRLDGGCGLTHILAGAKQAMLAELDRHTLADVVSRTPSVASLLT